MTLNMDLGQVFTPEEVASYMSRLITNKSGDILDPCFGNGVFLRALLNNTTGNLHGNEIDSYWFKKVCSYFSGQSIHLTNQNFFDLKEYKFDVIIMNPPYIRHEKLVNHPLTQLRKDVIRREFPENVPSQSNLYVYFFLKSLELLKQNGEIVAIIPSNWMSARYGIWFKTFLTSNFKINSITKLNFTVFDDALTDVCIVHLKKQDVLKNYFVSFVNLNKFYTATTQKVPIKELHPEMNWEMFFDKKQQVNKNLIYLEDLCKVKRGLGTNWNDFFIYKKNHMLVKSHPSYFQEIISSPKDIESYFTSQIADPNYLLSLKDTTLDSLPDPLKEHIKNYERLLITHQTPKTIWNNYSKAPDHWFEMKSNSFVGDFLFSYIIRKNKRFIINDKRILARDNFYLIQSNNDFPMPLLFAIFNSSFTQFHLELIGRNQGNGLKKIQVEDIKKLEIINPNLVDKSTTHEIELTYEMFRKESIDFDTFQNIIDNLLQPFYNLELEVSDIRNALNLKVSSRIKL